MQKWKVAGLGLLLAYTLTVTAVGRDVFAIKTALHVPAAGEVACAIPMTAGDVLEFSARDLERRLSLDEGELGGITVTALPTAAQGGLFLDGVEVEAYEFLDREALDRLCFVPGDASDRAAMAFLPQAGDAAVVSLSIQVLATPVMPPEIAGGTFETAVNVMKTGAIAAGETQNGPLSLRLAKKPEKGAVTFSGLRYTYRPYKDVAGQDLFTVCAVDALGAYSREVAVHVYIEQPKNAFSYLDMQQNPSNYAAVKLQEAGVMTGVRTGNGYLFEPEDRMTRGEYLLLLLAAAGLEHTAAPAVNTGLPGDADLPGWLKPYVKAALEAGIIAGDQPFRWQEIPIRAEAVLMCDRAARITDVKFYPLEMPDTGQIPDWARPSYENLAAYQMLDLHEGKAAPAGALTNSYAADLVWQLYKHTHR